MRDLLDEVPGEHLGRDDFKEDFSRRFWRPTSRLLKFEFQQQFLEPADNSWAAAFIDGDWERAMSLIDARWVVLEEEERRMRHLKITSRRLRVVTLPLSSYLQWELWVLRQMNAISDDIRVLDAAYVQPHATGGVLPEVVVVDDETTFEVLYGGTGELIGAVRRSDPGLASACRTVIGAWYEIGQDVGDFCAHHLTRQPPPDLPRMAGPAPC